MTVPSNPQISLSLEDAIDGARAASRQDRMRWRDPIARHGADAIEAAMQWANDRELAHFSVTVIEAAAKHGDRDAAIAALGSVARIATAATVRSDAQDALGRLRPTARQIGAKPTSLGVPERAGLAWPGFAPTDFGRIAGTTWRRRSDPISLVPLILRPLLELDPGFSTYPIYGSPEVHFADRDRYSQGGEWKQGWRASKLVVYAHGPTEERPDDIARVVAGWYLELGTGTDDYGPVERALWDWPLFLDFLRDPIRRASLEKAFETHALVVGEYVGGRFLSGEASIGVEARFEEGRLVVRDRSSTVVAEGWEAFVDRLDGLPRDHWHDLHIWHEWPAHQAIEAGRAFAGQEIVPVMVDLARSYLEVIRPRSAVSIPGG